MLKEFIRSKTGLPLISVKEQVNEDIQRKIKEDQQEEKDNISWLSENMIPRSVNKHNHRYFPTDMVLHLFTSSQDISIIPIWKDYNSRGSAATFLTGTGYDNTAFAKGYLNDLYFFLNTDQNVQTGILNIAKTSSMMGSALIATIQATTAEGSPILTDAERAINIPMNDIYGSSYKEPKKILEKHLKDHMPGNPNPLQSFMQRKIDIANMGIEQLPAYFSLNMSRSHRDSEIDPLKIAIRLFPSIWDNHSTMTNFMKKYYGNNGVN